MPTDGPVRLEITHFYDDVELDVDNIPKPIMDALKGFVFGDDDQVTVLLCRKRNLRSSFPIDQPPRILAEGLSRDHDFLYIVVMEAPDQEAVF